MMVGTVSSGHVWEGCWGLMLAAVEPFVSLGLPPRHPLSPVLAQNKGSDALSRTGLQGYAGQTPAGNNTPAHCCCGLTCPTPLSPVCSAVVLQ